METYQAVQAEIARRRELGVFANWSINTSCFTSKIKCGLCSASFVRNTRNNWAKTSQLGERYTFYGCGTNKRKGAHCSSGTIREEVLKEECAKVLGLPEFNEETFSERVKKITIPAPGIMIFDFTDGTSLEHHWSRNAKKQNGEKRSANTGAVGNPDGSAITPSPTSSNAGTAERTIVSRLTSVWTGQLYVLGTARRQQRRAASKSASEKTHSRRSLLT